MSSGPGSLHRVRFPGKASGGDGNRQGEKITAGVPLAQLIRRRLSDDPAIVMINRAHSVPAEQFRRLKTWLSHEPNASAHVFLVTSPAPGEGKSVVAINLALALAADQQGEVLLIDGDLRRPTIEHWLSPEPKLGLSELLLGQTELEHAVLSIEGSPLKILPAGAPSRDPVELLAARSAQLLMKELRERFRRVVFDTPPIVPFTDADAIGALCDGALMVVRAGATRQSMYLQALESISSTPIIGTVLNDVTFNLADRDTYHHEKSYYRYYDRDRRR